MRKLFVLFFLLISSLGYSQDTLKYYDCTTSSFYFSEVFKKHFWENDLDSARMVLDTWVKNCGNREVNIRARVLLDMKELGEEMTLPDDILYYLMRYKERAQIVPENRKYYYEYNRVRFGYIPIGEYFDDFTELEFAKIHHIEDPELNFVRKVYMGNYQNIDEDLNAPSMVNTSIGQSYHRKNQKKSFHGLGHYSIGLGAWVPLNKGSVLGPHTAIGMQVGSKIKKWNVDMTVEFRFGKSSNEYLARRKESNLWEPTKNYFGGFFGLDAGYDLFANSKNEFQIFSGVALDGFDALDEKGGLKPVSVYTFDFSFGLAYRHKYSSGRYWGLQSRYHVVDYTRQHTVNFDEQPISILLVYGFVGRNYNRYRVYRYY